MGPTVLLRSTSSRIVGAAAMIFATIVVGSLAATGEWANLAGFGPWLGLVGLLGWSGYWSAYVEVSDGGVTMRNLVRTITVPWPSVESIEGRYGLQLHTAYGKITAWAAPAPAGRSRRVHADSEMALVARQRWESLRSAGYLDDPRLEMSKPLVRWHVVEIAIGTVLVALGVISAVG